MSQAQGHQQARFWLMLKHIVLNIANPDHDVINHVYMAYWRHIAS